MDLAKIGEVDNTKCDYCGAEEQTMEHLTFECPFFKDTRCEADKELSEIEHHLLPIAVKLGIAPAISMHANCTYWGSEVGNISKKVKGLLGCKPPPGDNMEAFDLQERLKGQGISARQAIACAKGGFGDGTVRTYPGEVKGLQPDQPNASTDGGLKNPSNHQWSCAGFGIWIPRSVPVSGAEQGNSHVDVTS